MKIRNRLCALLLSVVMVITYMPAMAFATAEDGTDAPETVTEETQESVDNEEPEEVAAPADGEEVTSSDSAPEGAGSSDNSEPTEEDELQNDEGGVPEEQPEEQPEEVSSGEKSAPLRMNTANTVSAKPDTELADSDDLLWDYLDHEIAEETGAAKEADSGKRKAKSTRGSSLSGVDGLLYDYLKGQIEYIIDPDEGDPNTSTAFWVPFSALLEKEEYPVVEIVVQDPDDKDKTITIDARRMPAEDLDQFYDESGKPVFHLGDIVSALAADLPYALYWYDKTQGTGVSLDPGNFYSDDEYYYFAEREGGSDPGLFFYFYVSADYSQGGAIGTTELDAGKREKVNSAVDTAAAIINQTLDQALGQSLSTSETNLFILDAYKNEVCSRVTYDEYSANDANEVAYGDPWQMISVFDGDPESNVVCEGYSKAFQYLCDNTYLLTEAGIECDSVTGTMDEEDSGKPEPHMWNILHMDDGSNYMADVTNSDENSVGENGGLFIAPALYGSVEDGYGYMDENGNGTADVTYVYDDKMRGIYSDEDLEMSTSAYEGPAEPVAEETIIPIELDETISFTATHDKDYQIYSFTPESEGCYSFESFGSYDTYGYMGSMDEGIFYESVRDDDSGENQNFVLYFDASEGQTVYLKASTFSQPPEGENETFEVRVRKSSRIESIELDLAEPLTLCEYTHGSWNYDTYGNGIWMYSFPGFRDGDTLTVTDGDGSTVYMYDGDCFRAEGKTSISLSVDSNQWENGQWDIGSHEFVFTYRGVTTTCPVEITASPVNSVTFTPAEPKVYVEGSDGDINTDQYGEEYFYYYRPWFRNGDKLNVDGTDYVFSGEINAFVSADDDTIDDTIDPGDFDWIEENQYSYHWEIGPHEFEFGYMGRFTTYPVEVIANPVQSIEYIPASPYIYYEGSNTYGTATDKEGNEHYLYIHPYCRQGDRLIINGTDTFTAGIDGEFTGPDGDFIEPWKIRFSSDQDNGEYWELGSSNYVTVTYNGRTCTVPVTIAAPTVTEISYQPAEEFVLIDHVDGWETSFYDEEDNKQIDWFRYHEPHTRDGDILTVGNKQYTLRRSNYVSDDGERIDCDDVGFTTDQSAFNPWNIDDEDGHYVTVSYKGATCTVPVTITANPVTGIEFVPSQPYRFYEHAGGFWEYEDEDAGEVEANKYYCYELPDYHEGDRLTVYKGDESVDYTLRYDQISGRYAFFTEDGSDAIDRWNIERYTSQSYDEQWQLGGNYKVTVSYMGVSCDIDVSVEANTVESIEYEPAGGAFKIIEDLYGYYDEDDGFFWYDFMGPQQGDRLTVHMESGDETVYEYAETQSGWYFTDISDDSNRLDWLYLDYRLNQDGEWEAGNTYSCTVEYLGKKCTADVMITENTVTGFSVTLTDPLRIRDSAFDYADDEDGYLLPYIEGWDETSSRRLFRAGDYISITNALGTQRYTLRGDNNYFDDGLGNKIYCNEIEVWPGGDWTPGGDPRVHMSYMGREADPVSVEIYSDPDHEHSLVHHGSVEAGCLTDGYAEFWYCQGCDRYFSDEAGQHVVAYEETVLKAAGHSWDKGTLTKEASCTEEGVMTYTCTACEETRTQKIPTVEHSWDEGEVIEPSTCYSKGTVERTCEVCGAKKTERLPLAPHAELIHVDAEEPTCTHYGHIEYWYCNDCNRTFSDNNGKDEIRVTYLPMVPHTLKEHPAEAATCENDGHETYWACTVCGALYADEQGDIEIDYPVTTAATGHNWGDWEQTKEPTCTESGVETRVCLNDSSHTETRFTGELGHDWTGEPVYEWSDDHSYVTASITCSRDDSHVLTETSHTSFEDTATCNEGGIRTYTAEFDNELFATQTMEVPSEPLGHDYQDIEGTAIEAGCETPGRTADRRCSRCGDEVEGETIPALGHDYQDVAGTAVAAECETPGRTADRRCSRCGNEIEGETVPALGHSYHDVAGSAIAAGCETDGKKADRKCSRCGDVIEGETIPAFGHNYQDVPDTAVAAGCETDGKKADRKCSRCGNVIIGETISATGHHLKKTEAKPKTCTVNGNIEYWTCDHCGKLFSNEEGTVEITEADTVTAATGHVWGDPVFTFSEGGDSATATRTCLTDGSHQETADAVVTSEITKIATATEPGEITYTATALFDEKEYTDTMIVEANTYIPEAISQLSAVGGTHCIKLAWTRSHEVNSETYCIYRREALTDQQQLIKKIYSRDTLSYTDEDVEDGKKYTYYVTCLNGYGQESAPSPEAEAAAQEDTEAPVVVQMSPAANALIGGTQEISAKATDNIQVTSIILSISADGGDAWQQLAQIDGSSVTYKLDTAAYDSGSILVRAVAYDAAGNESEPFSREFVIDNDCPAQVTNLTAESTASSVTLKWNDNEENDIRYYRVEQVIGDELKKVEDVNALGVVIHGLKSSTEYTYQVTAYDILGNRGTPSDRVTVTTADDDIAPQIVSIRPEPSFVSGELLITVKARDNMGLASAVIQYSRDDLSWSDLEETEFEGSPEEATATGTINTDALEEGKLYVRARVTDVNGNENDYIRMEPVEYSIDRTAPARVTGLSAEASPGSISLSWLKSEEDDLKGYNVYRSEDGEEFALAAQTSSNSCIDHTAKTPGQNYIYKVAAVDAAGNVGELSDAAEAEASADTEAPVINAYEPAAGSKIGPGKKKFSILLSDNSALAGMRITYTVDSADGVSDITEEQTLYENNTPDSYYLNITGELPVDDLEDGDVVRLRIYASDTAGNELAGHEDITYRVDKTAPVVDNVTASLKDDAVKLQIRGNGASDLIGYYIYRKGADGKYEYLANVPSAGRLTDYDYHDFCEYTDTSVVGGSTYSYMAVAYDDCGNTGYRESEEVIIPEQVILKAELTCDDLMEGNVEYYFSGIKSESSLGIREFRFDFGDGSDPVTGTDARVIHRYKEPDEDDADGTDTYTVTLTVTDNGGNTNEIKRVVKVKRQALVGTVNVTVVDPNGGRLSNVPVYFDMDNTLDRVKFTDGNGQVQFVSDAGMYSIGAYTSNYLPIRRTMTVNANTDNEMTLTLTEKELVTGTFEVKRLTLDEIRDLGINTSDPDNMHYARINVTLTYGEVEVIVDRYGTILKVIKAIGGINLFPGKPGPEKPPIDWPDGGGGGGGGGGGSGSGGGWGSSAPSIPFIAVLEVPVETSFLKEFFDVKLHLLNNASSEFTITDNVVDLEVPEGMTLMDLEQTDGAVVHFDTLSGQETKTIDWCLRGDDAGSYDLTAHYSGKLREFAADVSGTYTTSEPIKVFGLSAGKVIMEVDPYVQYGAFYTKISLQNVGDADMYLPSIGIVNDMIRSTERYAKNGAAVTVTGTRGVTLLNEYLEDESGYCQAIPAGGLEVLSKGQMLSRRYACYDAIRTEDLAELKNECHSIAEGYGIDFEFRVRQHDPYETGDTETAQAKMDHILSLNGRSTYDWITDYGNENFYYYIQSVESRQNFFPAFAMQAHRTLSAGLRLDFDLFTNDDKKEVTRRFISEIMRDESYARQLDETLEDEYLDITSDMIDWMLGTLNSNLRDKNLEEMNLDDVSGVLKSAQNIRKLTQAVRNGEPETFTDRMWTMIASSGMVISEASLNEIYSDLVSDTTLGSVEDEFKDSVTSRISGLGEVVGVVGDLVGAYNNSAEIYNQLLTLYVSKEQATELLDIILESDRDSIDTAVYDEVSKLRKDLDKNYLDQSEIFMDELGKLARDEIAGKVVDKTLALIDKHFFDGASFGPISAAYQIAGMIFSGVDYTLGWGTAVDSLQNLQVAADLTRAVRSETGIAESGDDPKYFLTCLKYLIKLRLIGERAYVEAAKQENEDQGILNMINDDYEANYADVDEYYRGFKKVLLSYRDSLFRDVESTVDTPYAPQAGIDYGAETTLQTYDSEYEYSFGGINWTDCTGEAIELSPRKVSRDLRIRKKADGIHPTGNPAYVAVPARPEIRGDAVCKYMNVKGSDNVYILTGIPDGTYDYEFTDKANLDKLGTDAKTLTVVGGTVEIADPDNVKSGYIALRKPAVLTGSAPAFASAVRTVAAEELKSGDINIVEVPQEADITAVADEFKDEASVVTVEAEGSALAEAAMQAADESDITAASVLTQLKAELAGTEGSGVTESTRVWDVRLVMQAYLEMEVKEVRADGEGDNQIKSIVVDIKPMCRIVATTKDIEDTDIEIGTNALVVEEAKELDLSEQKTRLRIKLPAAFDNASDTVYVLHNDTEEYEAAITQRDAVTGDITIEFETNGFSPFKVNIESETVISMGDIGYTSMQAAVTAAGDGDTITLEGDVSDTVTVSGKDLTINAGSHDVNIVAGEGTVITRTGSAENGDLVIAIHHHVLNKVDAVPATYDSPGNTEYWTCSCGRYFSDEAGNTEIEKDSWIIPKMEDQNQNEPTEEEKAIAEAKTALDNVVSGAKGIAQGSYTDDSFKALQDAIAEAEALAKNGNATAAQLRAAADKITAAKNALKQKETQPAQPVNPEPAVPAVAVGQTEVISGNTVVVTSIDSKEVEFTKARNAKKVTVPDTVSINGEAYNVTSIGAKAFAGKNIRNVIIGKNVRKIKTNAFKGSKATSITLKTKLLKKAGIKGSLKGSKIKNVIVKVGNKKTNKQFVNSYKKIFTKKIAGVKVTVK